MRFLCQYEFKKGKRKNQSCQKLCYSNVSIYCKKHIYNDNKRAKPTNDYDYNNIISLQTSLENKEIILQHYHNMKRLDSTSTEYYKNKMFVDKSLAFPWNLFYNIHTHITDTKEFIKNLQDNLNKEIYGMENVKNEIVNIVCKFITNPQSNRNNIALFGNAGVAKSKFIKVLSQVLNIPMKIVSLGGIKDCSFFLGHGYVYVESGPGKIIQNIIDSKISNPIIYFDELDKVSESANGKDIYSFLCYLTDNTQNKDFTDHYFYGMKFDLSKVFYIFTFNDITKIDKILLDRLNVIYVETPSDDEIVNILHTYCIPEIINNIKLQKNIVIDKSLVKLVISMFKHTVDTTVSSGIREYYRILEKIFLQINKDILLDTFYTVDDKLDISTFKLYLSQIKVQTSKQNSQSDIDKLFHMYI